MTAFRAFGEAALDRGLHLGDGVFETVLVQDGAAAFLAEHVARLVASCGALGVPKPLDLADGVREALPELWAECGRPGRAALRITVTRGAWTGLEPEAAPAGPGVYLVLRELPPEPRRPLDAVTLDRPRIDPLSPLAGHKTLSWMPHVEARRAAVAARVQVGLLRTLDGDVAEADAANLFVVVDGTVATPPLDRGCLPGITRARVLRRLRAAGTPVEERRVLREDLARATEAFVTSSLSGVVRLHRVDGRLLRPSAPVADALAARVLPDRDG